MVIVDLKCRCSACGDVDYPIKTNVALKTGLYYQLYVCKNCGYTAKMHPHKWEFETTYETSKPGEHIVIKAAELPIEDF